MLKLKKIQILGFKSFCDRTEVSLPGQGVAVIVGPNGCGKSNILDAVSWVLGEQSAKTLRGGKMEDVIFAGTRERKQLGMAEVSLTLIDPEAYATAPCSVSLKLSSKTMADWNEEELRARTSGRSRGDHRRVATRGQVIDGEPHSRAIARRPNEQKLPPATPPNTVVLKIRRRKFQKHSAARRDHHHPPTLPHRRQRISAERQALPAARHSGHLHGHRPRPRVLRHHRPGAHRPACSARSRTTAAPSSKRPPASPASRPRSVSPNSASSSPNRTSPASTTSSTKSRARWALSSARRPRPSATAPFATSCAPASASCSPAK